MNLLLVTVGKLREPWAKLACDEYIKRLKPHFRLDVVEVREAAQIEKQLPPRYLVWMFDEQGELLSSPQLAAKLKEAQLSSAPGLCLLIGGPDGFPPSLRESIRMKISLSKMTFPYQIARVVVVEQLYRAVSILRNEPYHR